MPSFEDNKGQRWTIAFTVGTAKQAKATLHADFLSPPADGKLSPIVRLDTDVWFLVDMLWLVCQEQAVGPPLSLGPEEFAQRLSGGPLRAAHDALMEALSDFFQSLGNVPVVRMIARQRQILDRAMATGAKKIDSDQVDEAIERAMEEVEETMDQAIDSIHGTSSTSLRVL